MPNPQVNFDVSGRGPTFPEGNWLVIKSSPQTSIVTCALWHGKNLVIVGQSDTDELHIRVKRYFFSLKGPAKLVIHWYENNSWSGIEFPFTIV